MFCGPSQHVEAVNLSNYLTVFVTLPDSVGNPHTKAGWED